LQLRFLAPGTRKPAPILPSYCQLAQRRREQHRCNRRKKFTRSDEFVIVMTFNYAL